MAAKNQKISDLQDAIAQIKDFKSQDSKNNPVLSEALNKMEKTLLDELYEEVSRQHKRTNKRSKTDSQAQKIRAHM
jgi:hypothetical protein